MSDKKNFLTFELGDNDFVAPMRFAMETLVDQFGTSRIIISTEHELKEALRALMAGLCLSREILNGAANNPNPLGIFKEYFDYFWKAKVYFSTHKPDKDCDHGAVSVDLSRADPYIWSH